MLTLRSVLVTLVIVATVGFVIGVAIERDSHHETAGSSETHAATDNAGEHSEEGKTAHANGGAHTAAELQPFGIDIEATPFIVLAALVSVGLAALACVRRRRSVLLAVGVGMLAFGVLDLREMFHQADVHKTGLAALAGVVAALHLASTAVTGLLARDATVTA
jgi:hypothetical protein